MKNRSHPVRPASAALWFRHVQPAAHHDAGSSPAL